MKIGTEYMFTHQFLIILQIREKQQLQTTNCPQMQKKYMHLVAFTSASDSSDIENYKLIQNPVKLLKWSFSRK